MQSKPTQADKFKELARKVEADEDEEAFDAALRKMRGAPEPSEPSEERKPK